MVRSGNPFMAMDSAGNQLYGVDANGDGVPDRGMDDLNNDGLMDYPWPVQRLNTSS